MGTKLSMKHSTRNVILLVSLLSLLVSMMPAGIVSAADDEPQLSFDGLKWQEVLKSPWGLVKAESIIFNPIKPGNIFSSTGQFSGGQYMNCILRPVGAQNENTMIRVEIVWSQDTQALAKYKDMWFNNLIAIQKDDVDDTPKPQVIAQQEEQNRILYIKSEPLPSPGGASMMNGTLLVSLPPNAFIMIMGNYIQSYFDKTSVVTMFANMEKVARDMLKSTALTIKEYNPFDQTSQAMDRRQAGDIVVTMTRAGKPAAGQTVFLFGNLPSSDENFNASFKLPFQVATSGDFSAFIGAGQLGVLSKGYVKLETDAYGKAVYNYLGNHVLDFDELGQRLTKQRDKPVSGVISAFVFDNNPEEYLVNEYYKRPTGPKPKVLYSADVKITFKFTARISLVVSHGGLKKPEASVQVQRPGTASPVTVTNTIIGDSTHRVLPEPEGWGFPLYFNDKVLVREYDEFTVQWISGVQITFRARSNFSTYGTPVAEISIYGSDSGWWDRQSINANKWSIAACVGIPGAVVSCWGWWWAAAPVAGPVLAAGSAIISVIALVPLFWQKGREWVNPVIAELNSQVLIEPNQNVTVATVEGKAVLHTIDNKAKTEVTAGHKVEIAPDGKFGSVAAFKESELSPDLRSLLSDVRSQTTSPAATTGSQATPIPSSTSAIPGNSKITSPIFSPSQSSTSEKTQEFLKIVSPVILVLICFFIILIFRKRRKKVTVPVPAEKVLTKTVASGQSIQNGTKSALYQGDSCSQCGKQIKSGDSFCRNCGAAIIRTQQVTVDNEPSVIFCPNCGSQSRYGTRFCSRCGSALPAVSKPQASTPAPSSTIFCYGCGTPNSGDSLFCKKCGKKLLF